MRGTLLGTLGARKKDPNAGKWHNRAVTSNHGRLPIRIKLKDGFLIFGL
jgi:hypothetical protein